MKTNKIIATFFFFALLVSSPLFAHKAFALEKITHSILNENISKSSTSTNQFLINNLKMENGVSSVIKVDGIEKTLYRITADGGETEDEPSYTRSLNHFHDPLKNWDDAGYSGPLTSLVPFHVKSSILWAQADEQYFGNYSWPWAREYFYRALTATATEEREQYYAETFRALGQLMHLVQDASVPAHTRNDGHAIYNYESWVKSRPDLVNQLSSQPVVQPTAPFASLIDTDIYTGENPDVTTASGIGLAEYTNANFFSEDTIFSDYPYPAKSSVEECVPIEDPRDPSKTVLRYYQKINDGDTGYLLCTVPYFKKETAGSEVIIGVPATLDEHVYEDYACRLIPRAVGYSSALLDYFFRGNIEGVDATALVG